MYYGEAQNPNLKKLYFFDKDNICDKQHYNEVL